MFFNSVNRLIHRYRETRMYVTEILYTANKEPRSLYSFMTEYNMEIELPISSIIKTKNIRSRNETMYLVHLSRGHNLLLFLDHRRGNHYAYCQKDTFDFIVKQYIQTLAIVHPYVNRFVAAASQDTEQQSEEINLSTVQNKIIIIDSKIVSSQPSLLNLLIENNEIIISPYYMDEIQAYVPNMTDYTHLISMIETLSRQNPGKLTTNMYIDTNAAANHGINPSDEFEYLLGIALQQPVTKSQVLIVTYNEVLATKAKFQSFHVHQLEQFQTQPITTTVADTSFNTSNNDSSITKELPPRSKRYQKTSIPTVNNL